MCTDVEILTPAELTLIRETFSNPALQGGLNREGMLGFASGEPSTEAWGTLSERVWRLARDDFVVQWRRLLAQKLQCDWYQGWSGAGIAEALGCHPGQLPNWRQNGIPIAPLLLALYLTDRWDQSLPRPSLAFIRRSARPIGIRVISCFFRQAGVIPGACLPLLLPWQMELFDQVLVRRDEWNSAVARARAVPGAESMGILDPVARVSVAAAVEALGADALFYTGEDLAPLRDLAADPRRAVAECLGWRRNREVYFALRWTIGALDDEMFDPRA